ncbi:hypothetical protein D3C78_1525950 [compost metagenome]
MTHFVATDGRDVDAFDTHHATVCEELGSDEDVDRDLGVDTGDLACLDVDGAFEELCLGQWSTKAFNLGSDLIRTHRVGDVRLWWKHECVRATQSCEVEAEVHAAGVFGNLVQSSTGFVEGVFRRIT